MKKLTVFLLVFTILLASAGVSYAYICSSNGCGVATASHTVDYTNRTATCKTTAVYTGDLRDNYLSAHVSGLVIVGDQQVIGRDDDYGYNRKEAIASEGGPLIDDYIVIYWLSTGKCKLCNDLDYREETRWVK